MEVKAKLIGEIDLFQKQLANKLRVKQVTTRYPQDLVDVFLAVDPANPQSIQNALILLKFTDMFGVNWDMTLTSKTELLLKLDDIREYLQSIKFVSVPHTNGVQVSSLDLESTLHAKLMMNLKYFQLGINKIVPIEMMDEVISTTMDMFDTEKLRWLINVERNTNNLEYSTQSTTPVFPLVNVQSHLYEYQTNIGVVVFMTSIGFLGLICIVNAINGFPPLNEEPTGS